MLQMNNDENYYSTSDLALASALSISEHIEKIDKTNPKRLLFSFKSSEKLQHKVDQYWKKELKIEPQSYFNQIRLLKTLIYEK